jgi:hypothetical protein
MNNPNAPEATKEAPSKPKQFKTMEIHAMPQPFYPTAPAPAPVYSYPQNYYQQYYNPTFSLLMAILSNESNKKFYQNEVLQIKMTKLEKYSDYSKIKLLFRSCEDMNDSKINFSKLHDAEFFVLRSTCDDDIHKVD